MCFWGNIQTLKMHWETAGEGLQVSKLIAPTRDSQCKRGKELAES
jgi:hypothetical protein